MIKKLRFIYIHHFKLMACLNLSLSIYLTYLFTFKGFNHIDLYEIVIAFKLIGHGLTLLIEKLFFSGRSFYYRNLGLSYTRIFTVFYGLDGIVFCLLFYLNYLCRSFI
ncbi:MAG: hypothetical protein REI78_13260 [Pedobacter sp.]|nr:hypothetical protein [Pedobacter sp.]MDQ8053996.1 hypothetical protein [Pedobacter sp.]